MPQSPRTVEPPYHDEKVNPLSNADVNNPKAGTDEFTEKTAVQENVVESPALDPRAKTTDPYTIPR
jgi:hypothetical protein